MGQIIKVDESKKFKKLIFAGNRSTSLDDLFTYTAFLFGLYLFGSIYFVEKLSVNDFLSYLLPLPISFLCYAFYRKIIEKKLLLINTKFSKKTNRKILVDFAKCKSYNVLNEGKGYLIWEERGAVFSHTILTYVIIDEEQIYFTRLKKGYRIDPPVLFSHLKLKSELQWYFNSIQA